jgi:signal transduction histidine kinase
MRARAREIGAKLDLVSAPGHGTTVQLRFEGKG